MLILRGAHPSKRCACLSVTTPTQQARVSHTSFAPIKHQYTSIASSMRAYFRKSPVTVTGIPVPLLANPLGGQSQAYHHGQMALDLLELDRVDRVALDLAALLLAEATRDLAVARRDYPLVVAARQEADPSVVYQPLRQSMAVEAARRVVAPKARWATSAWECGLHRQRQPATTSVQVAAVSGVGQVERQPPQGRQRPRGQAWSVGRVAAREVAPASST